MISMKLPAVLAGALALTLLSPISAVHAFDSQGGEVMVILNPGGGQELDGSDGLRMVFNSNNDEGPNLGSDQVYFTGQDNWCCGGAGPVLAVGLMAFGEAGAARNEALTSWDSVVVSGLTGALETVAAGSGNGASTATGDAGATITYTIAVGALSYEVERVISYTFPRNFYDETWTVTIPATNADEVKLYIGGDSAPGGSDNGIGSTVVVDGKRSVREANPDSGQYFAYSELNSSQAFTHYFVGKYNEPYSTIGIGGDLDDTIDTSEHDAGIQIQWSFGTTPGAYVRTMRTTVGSNSELDAAPAGAEEASVPGIFLTVAGHIGRTVGESPVYFGAERVAVESEYTLSVRPAGSFSSARTVLADGSIDADGSFSSMVRLPQLTPGNYLVQFSGTYTNGSTLELTCPITVGLLGTITEIGDNVPVIR